jgi:hypothetical protein
VTATQFVAGNTFPNNCSCAPHQLASAKPSPTCELIIGPVDTQDNGIALECFSQLAGPASIRAATVKAKPERKSTGQSHSHAQTLSRDGSSDYHSKFRSMLAFGGHQKFRSDLSDIDDDDPVKGICDSGKATAPT